MSLNIIFTKTGNDQGLYDPSEGCLNINDGTWSSPGYFLEIPRNLNDCGACFPTFIRPDNLIAPDICNMLWRFSMWIETSTGVYVNGTYTGDNYGNASTLGSSAFKPWNIFIYLDPCVEYRIIQQIEFCDQQGDAQGIINVIPILRCPTFNNCYTLTPCSEEYPVLFISNNFESYLNQIVKFRFTFGNESSEDICYLITQSETCCNHEEIVGYDINGEIVDVYEILGTFGNCESCQEENISSNCWDIELCDDVVVIDIENPENPPSVLYPTGTVLKTTEDLSAFNGFYIKLKFEYCVEFGSVIVCPINTIICAKISQSNVCIDAVPLNDLIPFPVIEPGSKSVTIEEGLFENCSCEELAPPAPPTPDPEPPCVYKPVCSVHQVKKALCNFSEMMYNIMLKNRFGIKNCCPVNEEKTIIKKEQVDVANKYDSRYCGSCEDCV